MSNRWYDPWHRAGEHWDAAYPIADVGGTLRRYGYDVGVIGNRAHLTADTPEDHAPYSQTGWPDASPYGWVFAGDVMPPPAGSGLPTLAQLGAQMVADRLNNHPGMAWLKYINWTPQGMGCRHESWEPGHLIRNSSDEGHNHMSCRTDYRLSRCAKDYDPVARVRAGGGVIPILVQPVLAGGIPAYGGRVLVDRRPMMHGTDARQAQQRLHDRGWFITVDAWYGGQSASVVTAFQRDSTAHGWPLAADGEMGPRTHEALWRRPISR